MLVTNWHVFEPQAVQTGGTGVRVIKAGERVEVRETITIEPKTTVARGRRYLTPEEFERQKALGLIEVVSEERDRQENLKRVQVRSYRYVDSATALVNRALGEDLRGKQNILVFNDEGHHAYRIRRPEPDELERDEFREEEEAEEFFKEATVWIEASTRFTSSAESTSASLFQRRPTFSGVSARRQIASSRGR